MVLGRRADDYSFTRENSRESLKKCLVLINSDVLLYIDRLHFSQEHVGRFEVDAADCKTVYLSEYVIFSVSIVKDLKIKLFLLL